MEYFLAQTLALRLAVNGIGSMCGTILATASIPIQNVYKYCATF